MNWTQIEGRWQQLKGQLRSRWGKLTDDDLENVAGKQVDKCLAEITPTHIDKPSAHTDEPS